MRKVPGTALQIGNIYCKNDRTELALTQAWVRDPTCLAGLEGAK
jgi:hypothetical protein